MSSSTKLRVHRARFFDYEMKAITCLSYNEKAGKLAVLRDGGSIEIWKYQQGKMYIERVIPGDPERQLEAVQWLAGRLFGGFQDGKVVEFDLLRLCVKQSADTNYGAAWCLTANEDRSLLAAGTEEGCVCLFDAADGQLQYVKAFDKQEGRILSIAWHWGEEVIVTGGVNNVRLWSVSSGRAMHRLSLGRPDRQHDTIVWAVTVTSDLTVVSGDSRGKTSFWSGHHGTLIKAFQSHKGAVLTVAMGKEGEVYSSGVDPVVAQFRLVAGAAGGDWQQWTRTDSLQLHSHDVRAITTMGSHFASGGLDTSLMACSCRKKKQARHKRWHRYPAVPHRALVSSAAEKPLVLLQYPDHLELVRLGHTNHVPVMVEQTLPLLRDYLCLLVLNARAGEAVVSSALSPTGDLLAYSDRRTTHVYSLQIDLEALTPSVKVTKLKVTDKVMQVPAHSLAFSGDGQHVVMATADARLLVAKVTDDSVSVQHEVSMKADSKTDSNHAGPPPSKRRRVAVEEETKNEDSESEESEDTDEEDDSKNDVVEPIHLLAASPDGRLAAAADLGHRVLILDLHSGKVVWRLPRAGAMTSALTFSPDSDLLLLTRSDQTIAEFEVGTGRWSAWSRQLASRLPAQWRGRTSLMTGAAYLAPHKLLLYDEQMICSIDKTLPLPAVDAKLFSRKKESMPAGQQPDQETAETPAHAFKISHRYKYLLYMRPLGGDWLVAVEKTPMSVLATLPPSLRQKKYGT